jgi:predicted Zn-dependent protease
MSKDREPRSLLRATEPPAPLLPREQTLAIGRDILGQMTGRDGTVGIRALALGETEFALGDVQRATDDARRSVSFNERFDDSSVAMSVNDIEPASLKAAVARAETMAHASMVPDEASPGLRDPLLPAAPQNPALWSDRSYGLSEPEARLAAIDIALTAADKADVVPSGWLQYIASTLGVLNKDGHVEYGQSTQCYYSLTARTKDGTGSGWAGWAGSDWALANPTEVAVRAIDLAERSKNPVAVEPGRYTVVMTPEACGDLVRLIARVLPGELADHGGSPFSKPGGGNKLGLRVLDERITLSADPMDPEGGFLPFSYSGALTQYVPVTWVANGVLKTLSYPTAARAAAHGLERVSIPGALRMSGGATSIEEMIASTTRGILVTRFSDIEIVSLKTLYLTGVTRNGTFLIENGKISKPVKNMRFEDSPFFFLNNVQALGVPRRVALPGSPCVMPAIAVRDFAFTSLTDAV